MTEPADPGGPRTATLTAAVLAEESRRQEAQSQRSEPLVLPDELLPAVGAAELSLRETLRRGGWAIVTLAVLLVVIEQLSRETTNVLAPDIRAYFGLSDTGLMALASFGGIALVLGAVPMAWLADRVPRKYVVAGSAGGAAICLVGAALAGNTFQLFLAYSGIGLAAAYSTPVFGSLISDGYPLEGRGRIFSLHAMATPLGLALGPFTAGSIATLAGGAEGWRWAYLALAVPVAVLAIAALVFLREPVRGRYEQETVTGEVLDQTDRGGELPITIGTAFARMKKIKTFYFMCLGIGALGLALITVPLQLTLLLRDEYGYGAFTRGWILSLCQIPSIVAMLIAGRRFDRMYRVDPARTMRVAGFAIVAYGVLTLVALRLQQPALLLVCYALATAFTGMALVAINPLVASVAPYRLRAQAFAIVPIFTFLMGGFLGALVVGAISDAHGQRVALTIAVPVSTVAGGYLFHRGARYLRQDISRAVEELLEEQEERRRIAADPQGTPVLQVRNLDFSYGTVQVLFGIDLEVARGEVLALLGTNGAGKSSLLRVISGLGIPDRGVIRLNGRSLTYAEAELRFRAGVVQLRGGAGIFPELTVTENLRTALLTTDLSPAEAKDRVDRALGRFPALADARQCRACDLSGGQQQMVALAMTLVHEPELLIIDELSLGLAPVVVQELLAVVEELKREGTTMIIVEQSLNLALSFADRAVFMEKGRIMFEGSAAELAGRDDLVRAVFLGETRGSR